MPNLYTVAPGGSLGRGRCKSLIMKFIPCIRVEVDGVSRFETSDSHVRLCWPRIGSLYYGLLLQCSKSH